MRSAAGCRKMTRPATRTPRTVHPGSESPVRVAAHRAGRSAGIGLGVGHLVTGHLDPREPRVVVGDGAVAVVRGRGLKARQAGVQTGERGPSRGRGGLRRIVEEPGRARVDDGIAARLGRVPPPEADMVVDADGVALRAVPLRVVRGVAYLPSRATTAPRHEEYGSPRVQPPCGVLDPLAARQAAQQPRKPGAQYP